MLDGNKLKICVGAGYEISTTLVSGSAAMIDHAKYVNYLGLCNYCGWRIFVLLSI